MIRKLPYSLFVVIQVLSATTSRCQADQTVRYNKDIRPILAENCVPCHGPDEANREADLRLDGPDPSFLKSIKSGDPQTSRLIRRIRSTDPDLCMPPPESKKKLNPQQIDLLSKWVAQGAKFENHWAFEPIQDSQPPQTSSKDPSMTDIDRYVNSRLESLGLSMSDPVSRQQLIRRATFDLTGLPPTWDEVQKFVSDPEPDAYARLLDRLLNSPAYGERWGRHWLDLARYADTFGGSAIGFQRFPFSYTYRDYVIRAFNNDLPYDRFIIEQIAADQLDLAENDPALAALGFLTVGMQFRNRNDLVDDQIDVTTRGLMGLTVACARCHDHKYDPIPTTDYYSLYATFERSRPPDQLPLIGPEPSTDQYRNYSHELKKRQVAHDDMARDQSELMRSRLRMQVGLYLKELAKETPEQDLSAAFLSYRTDDIRPLVLNRWRDYLAQMPADDPVFGPWVVLFANRKESPEAFGDRVQKLLSQWKAENGDPKSFQNQNQAGSSSPRWNPMVLDAIESQKPKTLIEVAEAYGNMFAQVNRDWLKATLEASLEAMPGASLIPDEDGRHTTINSAIAQQVRRHLFENATPTAMDRPTATTLLNRTIRDNLNGKNGAVENLNLTSPGSPPRAMSLTETSPEKPYQVFRRGSPLDRGEIVQPR
ncbi:MAG: hypothetical protein RJA81_585, partial [Planctomycetota bacterium]